MGRGVRGKRSGPGTRRKAGPSARESHQLEEGNAAKTYSSQAVQTSTPCLNVEPGRPQPGGGGVWCWVEGAAGRWEGVRVCAKSHHQRAFSPAKGRGGWCWLQLSRLPILGFPSHRDKKPKVIQAKRPATATHIHANYTLGILQGSTREIRDRSAPITPVCYVCTCRNPC